MMRILIAICCCVFALSAHAADSVFIEELTWVEVRDAIKAGKTTIIFPTGGTEQNGPHMVLGKHNFIVKHAAGEIARRLGNALVAPVLTAHPTEVRRKSQIDHKNRIAELMKAKDAGVTETTDGDSIDEAILRRA